MSSCSSSSADRLQGVLASATVPLSVRTLSTRYNLTGEYLSTYQLLRALRDLQSRGMVECKNCRWSLLTQVGQTKQPVLHELNAEKNPQRISHQATAVSTPVLSKEAENILRLSQPQVQDEGMDTGLQVETGLNLSSDNGPWDGFRRLLKYYRSCLREEEGAEASAYQNQIFERFLYLVSP